jgi:4'-phosphopantetheinyl transferase EntD
MDVEVADRPELHVGRPGFGPGGAEPGRMTTDRDELSLAVRRELPPAIAVSGGALETARGELFPVEAAAVERAVAKRRDEFVAGRTNARRALAALGAEPVAIPIGPRRAPVWPNGIAGSISHCKGYCIAIAARARDFAGVGIDVELDEPISDGVAARICFGDELSDRVATERRIGMDLPKLLFSIKESVYKAYFPLAETFLDFSDVTVELDPRDDAFVARLTTAEPPSAAGTRVFRGRFVRAAGIVASWTTIPPRI